MNPGPRPANELPFGTQLLRFDAAAVADGSGQALDAGSILVELTAPSSGGWPLFGPFRVLAVGRSNEVDSHEASRRAIRVSRPGSVLVPGFVNAHTHLDLTGIGPRAYDDAGGFVGWIDMLRRERPTREDEIRRAVHSGVELSHAGGVVAVGDISGAVGGKPSLIALNALRATRMRGVSFIEFFAIGSGEERGRLAIESAFPWNEAIGSAVRAGVSPHAANTVAPGVYEWCAEKAASAGIPLTSHIAETFAERRFVSTLQGPQREFIERIGLWDDRLRVQFGQGKTPVAHLAHVFQRSEFLLAHVNDATDQDISLLAASGQRVVYCPRAHEYFRNETELGPHRYRDMLAAGVPVALGTDSIVNLPQADVSKSGISILDEMKLLHRRDGVPFATLLRMATTHGAVALGADESQWRFAPGRPAAGIVAIDMGNPVPRSEWRRNVLGPNSRPVLLLAGN